MPGSSTPGGLRYAEPDPFDEDSPQFHEAEREAVAHLDRNPRDVKRFDNAFRLQLHVAAKTPGCGLRFDREDLIAVAKWVAVRLRWPEFADACDEDDQLLARIEALANANLEAVAEVEGLIEDDQAWFDDPELMALLRDPRPRCRIGRLQDQTFLRIS